MYTFAPSTTRGSPATQVAYQLADAGAKVAVVDAASCALVGSIPVVNVDTVLVGPDVNSREVPGDAGPDTQHAALDVAPDTAALTVNPLDGPQKVGTVGRPLPGIEVAIVDNDGRPVPDGHDGEIVARGATIMRGYLNKPTETPQPESDGPPRAPHTNIQG